MKKNVCIVDDCSKFSVVKKVESMSAEDLIWAISAVLTEYGLAKKLVSGVGTNFFSEQFKEFCRCLSINEVVTSSYYHQSNGQVEAYITFVKCDLKKCRQTNRVLK